MNSGDRWWEAIKSTVTPLDQATRRRPRQRYTKKSPGVLDLHGMTVQEAYEATRAFIEESAGDIVIITGKSGQIRQEFTRWLEGEKRVRSCDERNGGGAFSIRCRGK